jgi:hypothetical protein
MKNKFYQVSDPYDDEGLCNIVIAPNAKEAKKIGHGYDATEVAKWVDLRVKAVKGGDSYWYEYDDRDGFAVKGNGFVYTDLEPQRDHLFDLLKQELIKQNRFEEREF